MNKLLIKILITTLVIAAVGQYTNGLVINNLRLRRRASRRQTEFMIEAANIINGRFGISKDLVV